MSNKNRSPKYSVLNKEKLSEELYEVTLEPTGAAISEDNTLDLSNANEYLVGEITSNKCKWK